MELVNKTKHTVLAREVEMLRTLKEKADGLLHRTVPVAVFMETRWGIHTVGMHFAIDCAVCDGEGIVRAIARALPPGKFFFWNPRHKFVYELPSGTLVRTGTEPGDRLEMQERV
jgi:uncharacterized membrane protein (UPF0127 family)